MRSYANVFADVAFVLAVGRFLRMYVSGLAERVPLAQMSDVDALLQLVDVRRVADSSLRPVLSDRLISALLLLCGCCVCICAGYLFSARRSRSRHGGNAVP